MIEIDLPDGSVVEFPDGTSPDAIKSVLSRQFGGKPKEKKPFDWRGLARQGLQGMTFGASDEIGAGIAAIPAAITTGNSIGDAYNDIHQSLQDERKAFKKENPKAAVAAEVAGGLATGGVGANKLLASKALQGLKPVARSTVIGAAEGGVYGGLSGDRGERATSAAIGATGGAVLPGVLHGIGGVARTVGHPVVERIKHASVGSPSGDARRYLARILARESGGTIDDLAGKVPKGREGMATLADVSQGGRGALEGLVADADSPGIRRLAEKTLTTRNAQQQSRLFDALDEGLNIPSQASVRESVSLVKKARGAKAEPLYDEARAQSVRITPKLKAIFEGVPEVTRALKTATGRVAAKRAAGEKVSHIDVINEAKRVLDDDIGTLIRQGKNNRVRDLTRAKNAMLKEVDDQVPAYKQARDAYAGDSALIDAAEKGKSVLRQDIDELDDLISPMSDSEKLMFRLGVKKAVREKLMQAREGTNAINRITSELNLERIKKAFPDEEAFNQFRDELRFEAEIFDTSRVLHNSKTAIRQSAQQSMERGPGGGVDIPVGGQLAETAAMVTGALRRLFNRGLDDEAREELGRILLTPLDDLPPQLKQKLNRAIITRLPESHQSKALTMLGNAARAVPASVGGTAPAIGYNAE